MIQQLLVGARHGKARDGLQYQEQDDLALRLELVDNECASNTAGQIEHVDDRIPAEDRREGRTVVGDLADDLGAVDSCRYKDSNEQAITTLRIPVQC